MDSRKKNIVCMCVLANSSFIPFVAYFMMEHTIDSPASFHPSNIVLTPIEHYVPSLCVVNATIKQYKNTHFTA